MCVDCRTSLVKSAVPFLLLLLSLWTCSVCLGGDSDKLSPLVLSEVLITPPPGSVGSWVELYNRTDKPVRAAGTRVTYNGKAVANLPPELVIGPYEIIVISFAGELRASNQNAVPVAEEKGYSSDHYHLSPNRSYRQLLFLGTDGDGDSSTRVTGAGFCTLEIETDEQWQLMDRLLWNCHPQRAEKKCLDYLAREVSRKSGSLLHPGAMDFGSGAPAGTPRQPPGRVCLVRFGFGNIPGTGRFVGSVVALPLSYSTPGRSSMVLPPPLLGRPEHDGAVMHRRADGTVTFGVGPNSGVGPYCFPVRAKNGSQKLFCGFVYELAEDPFFESLLDSQGKPGLWRRTVLDSEIGKTYFFRVKWVSPFASSQWTEPVRISFR